MKLHLGCGKKFIPGWTHIDVAEYPHINFIHPVDNLPMIGGEQVDVIYACHVLEHFMHRETVRVLREWHRILRWGGLLRLAVPDAENLIKLYRETRDLKLIMGPLIGGQKDIFDFHYALFDYSTLEECLRAVGFKRVRRYDWRETEHADLDDYSQSYYPHMAKDTGLLLSLNVEANK